MGWADPYIPALSEGRTVQCRPRGGSMAPRIKSGQLCTIEPVAIADISKDDIVLCKVQGSQYLHFVKQVADDGRLLIGNARGGTNGWTRSVYGRLVRVED